MGYYDNLDWNTGKNIDTNYAGLDPSQITTSQKSGDWNRSMGGGFDWSKDTQVSADTARQTYRGPGGEWVKTGTRFGNNPYEWGVGWTNASGKTVSDLPGYLKKGSLQQTGSDFSAEQNQLAGLMSDPSKIQQTAGYQFDVDQGNQAINRSAAARGQLGGGGVLAELAKYGQGMASREYGNQVNRLSSLIGQKQQFGLGSGYYDDLKTPQITGGGGGSRAAPAPQKDPYADMAARENAQLAQHDATMAQWDKERAATNVADQQNYLATYGRERPY